jgi:hypothetical protein
VAPQVFNVGLPPTIAPLLFPHPDASAALVIDRDAFTRHVLFLGRSRPSAVALDDRIGVTAQVADDPFPNRNDSSNADIRAKSRFRKHYLSDALTGGQPRNPAL